jgi:hypothetical protein
MVPADCTGDTMSKTNSSWSDDEDVLLKKYFRLGYTDEQSASLLPGRTPDAVAARRGILKLEKGPKLKPKVPRKVDESIISSLLVTEEHSCRNIINNMYCGGFVPASRRRRMCYCDNCYKLISGGFSAKYK